MNPRAGGERGWASTFVLYTPPDCPRATSVLDSPRHCLRATFVLDSPPHCLRATFVLDSPPDCLRATFVLDSPPDCLRANVPNVRGDGGVGRDAKVTKVAGRMSEIGGSLCSLTS